MKKLLVIVMALMPSLSICSFAQEGGGTLPDDDSPINPIQAGTTPRPRSGGDVGNDDPNAGGPIDLGLGGVRPRSGGDHVEEEKNQSVELKVENPRPRGDDGGDDDGDDDGNYGEPLINLHNGGTIPRSVADVPDCYVSGGVVYFEADPSITYMEATVTSLTTGQSWTNTSLTNILSVTASAAPDSYTIGLTLSDDTYYVGEYTIE